MTTKFKVSFPFVIREALAAAEVIMMAVAQDRLPLLSIRGDIMSPTFHYERGVVVRVHMVDGGYMESHSSNREVWAVTHADVRYYPEGPRWTSGGWVEKIHETWGADRLPEGVVVARPIAEQDEE